MRWKRTLVASIGLALAVGTAACSPGTGQGGGGSSSGGKKLTYVYFTDGPDEQVTRDLIAKFEKQTGAKVDLQIVPYADLEQQLQARLSGSNPPDVARVQNLTPYRDDLLNLKKEGQDIGGQYLDAAQSYISGKNGELQAVPSDLTVNGPFINVDQFRKAGVAPPTADKPWTWNQLVANAEKVQKANKTEYAIAFDKSGHRFATMLSQFGTGYYTADGKSVDLDPAKTTAAVKLFTDLNKQDAMPKDFWLGSGSKYKGANDIFLAQSAPVYVSGNWQVSQFATAAKFTWATIPNPCQARCGGFPGGKFMVGFKESKNPKLAAQFIAFMNSKESQTELCQKALFLPTRKDLIASGVQYPSRQDDMNVFLADLKKTPQAAFANNYSPAFQETADAAVKELSKVIAGQETADAAVTALRKAAQQSLQDAG
ncbi:ABC transporter substrate-binding protein [Actinoallomurus acanthiterrae]